MNLEFSDWNPIIGAVLIGASFLFIWWMCQREPKPRAPSGLTMRVTALKGGKTEDAVAIGMAGDGGLADGGNVDVKANENGESKRALAIGRTTEKGLQTVLQNPTPAEEGPGRYKMEAIPRGLCLIINNIHFEEGFSPRYSAKETAEPLKKLFEKFHFRTLYWESKSADMMMTAIRSVAEKDHSQYDCFVCFVLTHGAEHKLLGSDGKTIQLKEFISAVSDQHCASLKGKPKLFFIEACRTGDPFQDAIEFLSKPDDDAEAELIDYFVGYSTQRYKESYRNNESGNIFTQEFISAMNDMGQREDLLGIMTEVNGYVYKRGVYDGEGVKRKQFPDMWNKLRRSLYF
ncbi:caspase-3-like [Haliotis rufescens]|uniref:caspase-3-like n=1 Tax=Haliotis rufescens TaxID=6454 RepID=UPI001EB08DE8|nr:caspase-3-like [Haliotis rufescens]XP_046343954.1 caspase-3-like [Haliotis rufescens]XP_048250207.1 caspase-3-like [Haliotis rufescens]